MKKLLSLALALAMSLSVAVPAFATFDGTVDEDIRLSYYAEYIQIAEDVSKETGIDISVLPMDEFKDEDWKTPQAFRAFITEVANWRLNCTASAAPIEPENRPSPHTVTVSATKAAKVNAEGTNYELLITGEFETGYRASTGRQHFAKVISITSKLSGRVGTWTQTGYEREFIDASRTVAAHVSGTLTIAGAVFKNKVAYVEFYCSDTGKVD